LRTLFDKDFKLNKTEFINYLKCPFLFYLKKELFTHSKSSLPRINFSDYESFLQVGLEKHLWLQCFYQKYSTDIQSGLYPVLLDKEKYKPMKQQFIAFEVNRYENEPNFWEPISVELFLENEKYCGKIDRIDLINEEGHCCVVEYKSLPSEFDEVELLFYAVLLSDLLPYQELPGITKVSEIAIYYYTSGELFQAKVTPDIIAEFKEYLNDIRLEMLDAKLIKKKKDCDFDTTNCLERAICQRITLG